MMEQYKIDRFLNDDKRKNFINYKNKVVKLCLENDFSIEEVFDNQIESYKKACPYHLGNDCNDLGSEHLAYDREMLEEIFGKNSMKCNTLCNKSCCAYINRVVFNPLHHISAKVNQ